MTHEAGMDGLQAVDPAALGRIEEIGGEALVRRILGLFFEGVAQRLAAARAALARGDVKGFGEELHSMRSSAAMVGAMRLEAIARDGEQRAAAGRGDGLDRLCERLAAAFAEVEEALRPRLAPPAGPLTVAVVEDNADNRLLVRAILEPGCRVVEYDDGPAALAGCASEPPGAILLDVSLPGMDGPEVLRRLRRDPALAATPILALTAHAMPGDRERYLAMGFDDYVPKPITDPADLRERVRRPRRGSAG